MSVRGRRLARRQRRDLAREARMVRLREGRNLRASRCWATIVQALAFVRKELVEILRQPRLLVLLVLGPFLLLLAFGAGYRDTRIQLRTAFVGPPGSLYERAVTDYAEQLDDYIEARGFTSDREAAMARLRHGDLDAVVVFPAAALDEILSGTSATIEVLHAKLDPFQQAAIEISSRMAVQEVNSAVLSTLAGGAQTALMPVADAAAVMSQHANTLAVAAAAGDTAGIEDAVADTTTTLADARFVLSTSREVVERLDDDAPVDAVAKALASVEAAQVDATALLSGEDGDVPARATELARDLAQLATVMASVTTIEPDVLVRPFDSETRNVAAVEVAPADYFAPAAVVLLLQHLALTFAALSLVRDRELGLLELLRVGPLSSGEILVGKTTAYLTVGVGVGAALLAAAVFVLGVPMQGSVAWVAVAVCLVLLASVALGMVLSMVSRSETQAVQFAMLTLLAGMFFSGFILDVEQLAMPYRVISYLLPVTYGIDMLQDVMLRGFDPDPSELAGLSALVLAYGAVAVVLLHRRLRTG